MQKHRQGSDDIEALNVAQSLTDIDVISAEYRDQRPGETRKAIHHVEQKMRQDDKFGLEAQLDQTMLKMLIAYVDAAESYSPPRVTQVAKEMRLRAGWSLDLPTSVSD